MKYRLRSSAYRVSRLPGLNFIVQKSFNAYFSWTIRKIKHHPFVKAAYPRGSFGTSQFKPFLSDLDLVVVFHEVETDRLYEQLVPWRKFFKKMSRINPWLADHWMLFLRESEWGEIRPYLDLWRIHAEAAVSQNRDEAIREALIWNRFLSSIQHCTDDYFATGKIHDSLLKKARLWGELLPVQLHEGSSTPHNVLAALLNQASQVAEWLLRKNKNKSKGMRLPERRLVSMKSDLGDVFENQRWARYVGLSGESWVFFGDSDQSKWSERLEKLQPIARQRPHKVHLFSDSMWKISFPGGPVDFIGCDGAECTLHQNLEFWGLREQILVERWIAFSSICSVVGVRRSGKKIAHITKNLKGCLAVLKQDAGDFFIWKSGSKDEPAAFAENMTTYEQLKKESQF